MSTPTLTMTTHIANPITMSNFNPPSAAPGLKKQISRDSAANATATVLVCLPSKPQPSASQAPTTPPPRSPSPKSPGTTLKRRSRKLAHRKRWVEPRVSTSPAHTPAWWEGQDLTRARKRKSRKSCPEQDRSNASDTSELVLSPRGLKGKVVGAGFEAFMELPSSREGVGHAGAARLGLR